MVKDDILKMTKQDFLALPLAEWDEEVVCASLIIVPGPGRPLHDSGYRTMSFVAVDESGRAFKRLSGCSDVLHFDGFGGYGMDWLKAEPAKIPNQIPISAWSIDCLPTSGFMRIFSRKNPIVCGPSLGSFEIFCGDKKRAL